MKRRHTCKDQLGSSSDRPLQRVRKQSKVQLGSEVDVLYAAETVRWCGVGDSIAGSVGSFVSKMMLAGICYSCFEMVCL